MPIDPIRPDRRGTEIRKGEVLQEALNRACEILGMSPLYTGSRAILTDTQLEQEARSRVGGGAADWDWVVPQEKEEEYWDLCREWENMGWECVPKGRPGGETGDDEGPDILETVKYAWVDEQGRTLYVINLIMDYREGGFDAWKAATKSAFEANVDRPGSMMPRAKRVEHFHALFRSRGLEGDTKPVKGDAEESWDEFHERLKEQCICHETVVGKTKCPIHGDIREKHNINEEELDDGPF